MHLRTLQRLGTSMNLDELVASVPEEELREGLSYWVKAWKQDESDIKNLACVIGKWQCLVQEHQ
jgi:hypothetical protein